MSVLIIVHAKQPKLDKSVLSCLTAAQHCQQEIDCLVVGEHSHSLADIVATLTGIRAVIRNDHSAYHHGIARSLSRLIASVGQHYQMIIAPANTWSKNCLPGTAALLNVGMLSDVTQIIDPETFIRPIYAGSVFIHVKSHDPIKVLTIRTTAFQSDAQFGPAVAITDNHDVFESNNVKWLNVTSSQSEFTPLSQANTVISGGRGFESKAQFEQLLHPLATHLGAALGASRAAVDAGFISNDHQIGQTGKVVAPNIYFAIGISGATQHLAGMIDSHIIIAINKDPNANIHQVANYSLIADLKQAIPALLEKIQLAH